MTKNQAKKYFSAIKNSKRKNVTCESLSREIGIYPEMIADALSCFEPMLLMDSTYKKLLDIIREHYEEKFLEGFAIWKIKIDAKINEGMLVAYFSTKGEIEEIIDTTL